MGSEVLYTCPMHPEIIRNLPGECPICGMALELRTISINETSNAELVDMSRRFWIGMALTLPVLILTMGQHIPGLASIVNVIPGKLSSWLQFLFATPVTIWAGWPILKRGAQSIFNKKLNMFTLIALGTSVAYVYSLVAILFPQVFPPSFHGHNGEVYLYFESAAAITTLVLMGQVLELRGREQTGSALRALLDLAPKTAHRITEAGCEEEVNLDQVQVNDILKVRPGEQIPVDGKIIEGYSSIDESMISGESIPVEKTVESMVIGSTLNISGSFIMRAERVGSETMLSQIVKQVSEAQRTRAPIQNLADIISSYFVPAVLFIAIITFIIWTLYGPSPAMTYGLISAIAVLIIACPCALGLATPMSIMVGMGRGAQAGILIKDAACIDRFEKVNILIVDKTGTLTVGKPALKTLIALSGHDERSILQSAASLENNSEHPLANAIVLDAHSKRIELINPTDFENEPGKGVSGVINNKHIALGNAKLTQQLGINITPFKEQVENLQQAGETVMYVIIDGAIAGFIGVTDPIKNTTKTALDILKKQHIEIIMVTGDNRLTAEAIAKNLEIDKIKANILPNEKNKIVQHLRQQGYIVAMAGDGINDASALAEADIGIAMGTGTDIAMKSASITLVKGDLMGIVRARILSQQVMRNIRQNLFLAFIYNILCIPLAAGILFPVTGYLLDPIIAATAMTLSSLSVIGNALRLRHINLNN